MNAGANYELIIHFPNYCFFLSSSRFLKVRVPYSKCLRLQRPPLTYISEILAILLAIGTRELLENKTPICGRHPSHAPFVQVRIAAHSMGSILRGTFCIFDLLHNRVPIHLT